LAACGEQYCQRGAKGAQCYTINQVEWQETQVKAEPPPERTFEPSPGCVQLTPNGPYVVPAASAGPTPSVPPLYVMSGACISRRQPAHGAIR
jgi:hypothetical protein